MLTPALACPGPTTTLVVMGVSGVGKSTVARAMTELTGWVLAEGDDFHPTANRSKLAAGQPLTDDDRWSWLRSIAAWIGVRAAEGSNAVVACSALRRTYRDLLREGNPSIRFVHLVAPREVISARLAQRRGHFMSPALLHTQFETLEDLGRDEPGVRVDSTHDRETIAVQALRALGLEPRAFVVHEHRVPRHHIDLRLEENGVLRSWAVPRGMPAEPGVNRLLIAVADHDFDHLTYTDADKDITDTGWWQENDRDDHRMVFTLHGRAGARRYVLVRTASGWLIRLTNEQPRAQGPSGPLCTRE